MRSTQGEYFPGLDHVRALAAFLVFTWHFSHVNGIAHEEVAVFPLSIFAEGHVGVAIFMALSGYIFAKLLEGRSVRYLPFLWNRVLRLLPLLLIVFVLQGILLSLKGDRIDLYLLSLLKGFVLPTWPNGGWSIAVEMHFYIILPLLLALSARNTHLILLALCLSIPIRSIFWLETGQVQTVAYWTILGGIDQFVLGIYAFKLRKVVTGNHARAAIVGVLLVVFMHYFDATGGFHNDGNYPNPSALWIFYPTLVGAAVAYLICWYDTSFRLPNRGASAFIARIGACSYSIYLLHFFVVSTMARAVDDHVAPLTGFSTVLIWSAVAFLLFLPIPYLSFRYIETPPLRYRMRYSAPVAKGAKRPVSAAARPA
ncbi:acyltransferase family protein [Pontivivens ytuae]|uniref:Acyltransferase n=1 Tax=Pontivivens ytuae TaxID=2789856 RepID=A0A7S9QDH2_9RHOB|nr:acyltransferase [Pontivivens ytuae]QPH54126.1 acyltransferase [Pontivivens ytuae]